MRQGDRDGLEGEFVARLLALLCSSVGRRYRKLVRINALILQVVYTPGRMILTSVLATEASCSGTRVMKLARPKLGA